MFCFYCLMHGNVPHKILEIFRSLFPSLWIQYLLSLLHPLPGIEQSITTYPGCIMLSAPAKKKKKLYTVAEYFIQPVLSIPTLLVPWDWGPVLVKVWLLRCSSFMKRCSNWACSSSHVDLFLLFLYAVILPSEIEIVPICSMNTQWVTPTLFMK